MTIGEGPDAGDDGKKYFRDRNWRGFDLHAGQMPSTA
jgi:hypothetical protein